MPHDKHRPISSRERYQLLTRRHTFAGGNLVTLQPGLRNKRHPFYGHPAVVIEVPGEPPCDSESDSGSADFREPPDLVLGHLRDGDPERGELLIFHYDNRRFQPWSEEN